MIDPFGPPIIGNSNSLYEWNILEQNEKQKTIKQHLISAFDMILLWLKQVVFVLKSHI